MTWRDAGSRWVALSAVAFFTLTISSHAHAEVLRVKPDTAKGDGVYGRFDGDLDLGVGLGVRSGSEGAGPALRLTAHYLYMAGIYVEGAVPLNDTSLVAWTGTAGIDLRPLFLPRWVLDLERGPAFVDLLIDSLALSGGAYVQQFDRSEHSQLWGVQVEVGGGIPLMAHAHGLWLHLRASARWPLSDEQTGSPLGFVALLSWQAPWLSPVLR